MENLIPAKDGLVMLEGGFGLKNEEEITEVASTDQEAADKFSDDVKKVIEEKGWLPEQ